jgi:hypothetical protein
LRKASLSHCRYDVELDREVTKGFAKSPHQAKTPSILGLESAVEIEGVFRFS